VIYRRTRRFKEAYRNLAPDVQEKVKKAFQLFQADTRHPSLQVKKMQGLESIWEGRIDQNYRFTFHYDLNEEGETVCVFRNVGPHAILDRAP
jgi:mRNA-degrading endonuclease RelE of RelBE toxin-antitoxin system